MSLKYLLVKKFWTIIVFMISSNKQSVEDLIVETLAKNPYTEGPDLVLLINKLRSKTTKQAVYSALKYLTESETVAKVGNKYFLSRLWLQKINQLFKNQKEKELTRDAIFNLKEKESISYHFPSLLTCDTYWAHIFTLLTEWISKDIPVFVWNPHEIFIIGRNRIEKSCLKEFEEQNKYAFFITRGKTYLDMEFKKTWNNNYVSISTDDKLKFANNYYLNIFKDFIIEVFIDEKLMREIDNFYKNNQKLNEENIKTFEKTFQKKYPVRMKISRKNKKAILLRKKLSKDFFIPKHLKIS